MSVYIHTTVQELKDHYREIFEPRTSIAITDLLERHADALLLGLISNVEACFKEISNYHPLLLGKSGVEILDFGIDNELAMNCVLQQYGYSEPSQVPTEKLDVEFEDVLDQILRGDISAVQSSLKASPSLVFRQSSFGHKATLLHYCASNGVEFWRQQVPYKLADMVALLLAGGADPRAKMLVYGGEFEFKELFETSAHPKAAGIYHEVITLL